MPSKRRDSKQREAEADQQEKVHPRPFWSGIVAFGLVSLPVSLFPANRGKAFHLKMVDDDGTPLKRRFFCEKEGKPLERDDIVRGYEVEKDQFVVIEDDELEALAPEKSREIDLKRFVALDEIDPVHFERAYFLVPDGGTTKAYRLLAESMEREQRAGIATFVMREREYLVAIIAEKGILRAETLRFHDEVRSPSMIGLPERRHADKAAADEMQKVMQQLKADRLERELLQDRESAALLALARKKLAAGKDVIEAPAETLEEYEEEESNVIDLMQVLKERLKARETPEAADAGSRKREPAAGASAARGDGSGEDLESLKRDELYERARELNIAGRSNMSKQQLIRELSRH